MPTLLLFHVYFIWFLFHQCVPLQTKPIKVSDSWRSGDVDTVLWLQGETVEATMGLLSPVADMLHADMLLFFIAR